MAKWEKSKINKRTRLVEGYISRPFRTHTTTRHY